MQQELFEIPNLKVEKIPYTEDAYAHIKVSQYGIQHTKEIDELYKQLPIDQYCESRHRAYLNLIIRGNKVVDTGIQDYSQTYLANNLDGGKQRVFPRLPMKFIKSEWLKQLITTNVQILRQKYSLKEFSAGMHFIRYIAYPGKPSFSSPIWLHKDDEPIVFVHLISVSSNLIGGDNVIAKEQNVITNVLRLDEFLDTLIVTKKFFHAVTPMGTSSLSHATRDIILFTYQGELNSDST